MNNKLMLKDYIGQKDINILVNIDIKGQKHESNLMDNKHNIRLLKRVYIQKDKKNNNWLYVKWESKGRILLNDESSFNDCGYSGVMLGDSHPLEKLYLNIAQ